MTVKMNNARKEAKNILKKFLIINKIRTQNNDIWSGNSINSMNNVFLQTGGNLGNRLQNLHTAMQLIEKEIGNILKQSSVYETEAWGFTDQPAFLNQVLQVQTILSSTDAMEKIHFIENEMGRIRVQKMGPRTIDIDILFFNDEVITQPFLTIPHPFIEKRRFVLVPLCEISPDLFHPVLKKNVSLLLKECEDESVVSLFKNE